MAFLSKKIYKNSSSDWLVGSFLFGTEIWGYHWKKTTLYKQPRVPVVQYWCRVLSLKFGGKSKKLAEILSPETLVFWKYVWQTRTQTRLEEPSSRQLFWQHWRVSPSEQDGISTCGAKSKSFLAEIVSFVIERACIITNVRTLKVGAF